MKKNLLIFYKNNQAKASAIEIIPKSTVSSLMESAAPESLKFGPFKKSSQSTVVSE